MLSSGGTGPVGDEASIIELPLPVTIAVGPTEPGSIILARDRKFYEFIATSTATTSVSFSHSGLSAFSSGAAIDLPIAVTNGQRYNIVVDGDDSITSATGDFTVSVTITP